VQISANVRRWVRDLRTPAPPPRLTRWSWAADAAIALVLTAGVLDSALSRRSVEEATVRATARATVRAMASVPSGVPTAPAAPLGVVVHHYGAVAPWQLALAVLAAAPLVARRRYPLWVFWTVLVAGVAFHLSPGFDPLFTFIASVLAAYSAAVYSRHRLLALPSAAAGTVLLVVVHSSDASPLEPGRTAYLFLIPVGLVGYAAHTWSQRLRGLERDKEAAARRAVEQERSRIARELHDVITHHVSVMVVQAGAARKIMKMDPDEAETTLLAVETGGRAAMTELRHAMDLLTMDARGDDEVDLAPPPGLGLLPALVDRVRDAGVVVELIVTGPVLPLAAGPDLAAYRVVQEALTNAMRHAPGARVHITVEHGPEALTVEVTDTGGNPLPGAGEGGGHGLIGLRERLAVYGGSLAADGLPAGGFRVRAVIPRQASLRENG
jgi:signal transduction histidine kinase